SDTAIPGAAAAVTSREGAACSARCAGASRASAPAPVAVDGGAVAIALLAWTVGPDGAMTHGRSRTATVRSATATPGSATATPGSATATPEGAVTARESATATAESATATAESTTVTTQSATAAAGGATAASSGATVHILPATVHPEPTNCQGNATSGVAFARGGRLRLLCSPSWTARSTAG